AEDQDQKAGVRDQKAGLMLLPGPAPPCQPVPVHFIEGGAKDVGRQEAQEQTKPPAAVDEELGNAGAVGRFQKRGQGQAKREEAEQNDGQLERGEDAKSPPEKAADGGFAEGLGSCGKLIGRGRFPRSRRLRNGPDGTRWVEQLGWGHGLSRREKREGIEVPG